MLVQQAASNQKDVYRPDTGPQSVVRDSASNIVGVKAPAAGQYRVQRMAGTNR